MASFASLKSAIYNREERKQHYQAHIRGLNAYERHKKFLDDYVKYYGKGKSFVEQLPVKTDQDALRQGYRFIRTEEDDMDTSWEQRLVKRYYDKLFKEYCIADMSKYKSGKIGLRWRIEKEVISGKGQFICGNKHCDDKDGLASYEVNFSYSEAGENKQALVKLVACERCAEKLNYRRKRQKELLHSAENVEYKRKRELPKSNHKTGNAYQETIFKNRPISEIAEYVECEHSKMQRTLNQDLDTSNEGERKEEKDSNSRVDYERKDDEIFDQFLEGMFP